MHSPSPDPEPTIPAPEPAPPAPSPAPAPGLGQRLTVANIRTLLLNHYTAPFEVIFKTFRLGVSLFLCGVVVMYGAHQLLQPSLIQELFTLAGLLLLGGGFLLAMLAQVRMVISRLLKFFLDK